METVLTSVKLSEYQQAILNALQDGQCLIFLDTNVLAWSFRLNEAALRDFWGWLQALVEDGRLVIPAWTVHEYNVHLLRRDPGFFLPHKSVGKQLKTNLTELDMVAHLMADDALAQKAGYGERDALLSGLRAASNVVQKCVDALAQQDDVRLARNKMMWEAYIGRAALDTDIHAAAAQAASDAASRFANRLAPGYEDAAKTQNATGDLIIWREILQCCSARGAKAAALVTNDGKPDWVYAPLAVELPNGRSVDGTSEAARMVRLPKPDLANEFARHTSGGAVHVVGMKLIAETLSSSELNTRNAQDFRQLAMAVKLDLARTPTEAVVQWFLTNRWAYREARDGVCGWSHSPSEVDQENFARWTIEKMANALSSPSEVRWGDVFCELFL